MKYLIRYHLHQLKSFDFRPLRRILFWGFLCVMCAGASVVLIANAWAQVRSLQLSLLLMPPQVTKMYMADELVGTKVFSPSAVSPYAFDLLKMSDETFLVVVLNNAWLPVQVYHFDPDNGRTRLIWVETRI